MGSAASAGRFERWWFVKELSVVCRSLGIWNREELEEALKKVLWQDAWCMEHTRMLWNDVSVMEETDGSLLSPNPLEDFQMPPYSPRLEIELENGVF